MNLHFSPKQRRALLWWQKEDWDGIICDGAVRSGKTLAMSLGFFCWAMSCFTGQQFALGGKTILSLRRNVLSQSLPHLQQMGMAVRERRSEHSLTIRCEGRENTFHLIGGKDEGSAAMIQGATFAGLLLEQQEDGGGRTASLSAFLASAAEGEDE